MTYQVRLGAIAHGGSCVARIDGRVVFVRHGLPGELVEVSITDSTKDRFWWGDVAKVIEASPDRVDPPCPVAFACGGCDFQHADLAVQRELKAQVIAEQLHRLAGIIGPLKLNMFLAMILLALDWDGAPGCATWSKTAGSGCVSGEAIT